MRNVAVIGLGMHPWGKFPDKSVTQMCREAVVAALADAGVAWREIEAVAAASSRFSGGRGWGLNGNDVVDDLGATGIPVYNLSAGCAAGGNAFNIGYTLVASGAHDVVLVVGAEKLKDRGGRGLPRFGHPLLARGNSAPGLFALGATRYMHTFGCPKETLAKVAVKNHWNGARNEKAHLRSEITVEQVMKAPMIASPFGLFDCCPTTDGAAAAIVCRADMAKQFKKTAIYVKGAALAVETGRPFFDPTFDYLGFRSTVKAAKAAYDMAGCGPKDISFADVHDCFTWTEISNIEDFGFYEKGQGWKAVEAGETALGGKIPINTSGGLKSFGHPIGASGVRMIYECVTQLRGECGERQVKNARLGMAHNVGGPGAVACVVILGHA